jgi:hypothetical protein
VTRRRTPREEVKRLDWRDPNMPVLRMIEKQDSPFSLPYVELTPVNPKEEQEHCAGMANNSNPLAPHYTQDPTYYLTNRRKRR